MILHLDLDSFFVSAERTKDKTLISKEVAVGGRSDQYIFAKHTSNKKAMIANKGAFVPSLFFSKKYKIDKEFFKDGKIKTLYKKVGKLREKYGIDIVKNAKEIGC